MHQARDGIPSKVAAHGRQIALGQRESGTIEICQRIVRQVLPRPACLSILRSGDARRAAAGRGFLSQRRPVGEAVIGGQQHDGRGLIQAGEITDPTRHQFGQASKHARRFVQQHVIRD